MQLIKNNAFSTLAGALTNVGTTMIVVAATGDRFPIVAAPDFCMVTLQDAANNIEIIKVTARASASDSMTIERAQEGTTARAWNIGDIAEQRITDGFVNPLKVMEGASTASGIRTKLGATATGSALFTAADEAAARLAIGASATTSALIAAADQAAARTVLGAVGTADTIASAATVTTTIASGATGTTQSPGDNSTKMATTAYVDAAAGVSAPPGAVMGFAMNTAPTGWLKANGAAVSRTTYAALFAALIKSATVTTPLASPGVVNWTAHGRSAGDPVRFTTTGALPTGLTAGTTYYVLSTGLATDSFRVAATPGGTAINFTVSQSGVHTGTHAPWGIGDGSTTFNLPDLRGEFPRGWDDGRAVDANRAFGTSQAGQMSSHTHTITVTPSVPQMAGGGNANTGYEVTSSNTQAITPTSWSGSATNTGGTENSSENRPRNVALMYCVKY